MRPVIVITTVITAILLALYGYPAPQVTFGAESALSPGVPEPTAAAGDEPGVSFPQQRRRTGTPTPVNPAASLPASRQFVQLGTGAPVSAPPVVFFSEADEGTVDALMEDLRIMSVVIERNLEGILEKRKRGSSYRMGIPLLTTPDSRPVQAMYLDGFGALFAFRVGFPLTPSPAPEGKKDEPKAASEWEEARRTLYGPQEPPTDQVLSFGIEFDPNQVESLKTKLLQTLKNAVNIRHLKADDFVVVTVYGGESPSFDLGVEGVRPGLGRSLLGDPDPADVELYGAASEFKNFRGRYVLPSGGVAMLPGTRGTILTARTKRGDIEDFTGGTLTLEQFREKVHFNTYRGNILDPRAALIDVRTGRTTHR